MHQQKPQQHLFINSSVAIVFLVFLTTNPRIPLSLSVHKSKIATRITKYAAINKIKKR